MYKKLCGFEFQVLIKNSWKRHEPAYYKKSVIMKNLSKSQWDTSLYLFYWKIF